MPSAATLVIRLNPTFIFRCKTLPIFILALVYLSFFLIFKTTFHFIGKCGIMSMHFDSATISGRIGKRFICDKIGIFEREVYGFGKMDKCNRDIFRGSKTL